MPPSLNFSQLDFVKPSSGFHPVTWECVNVSHEEAAAVDQTESVGDSNAMLSDCPTIPSKVLHVHGYGEKLKSICIYGVLITLLINVLYCLCQ